MIPEIQSAGKRRLISARPAVLDALRPQAAKDPAAKLDSAYRLTVTGRRDMDKHVFADLFQTGYKRQAKLAAADTLLANLIVNHAIGKSVRASRDTSKTSVAELAAADELIQTGAIEMKRGHYDKRTGTGKQTRYRLTPEMVARLVERVPEPMNMVAYEPSELIVLRNEYKQPIPMPADIAPETRECLQEREYVIRLLNTVNGSRTLTHRIWDAEYEVLGWRIGRTFSALKAVYNNGSFEQGGRLYAPYQNLRKCERKTLKINDKETVECDYSCLHPRLLYNLKNLPFSGDAYRVFDKQTKTIRKAVKIAFNALLNANTETAALKACQLEIMERTRTGNMKDWYDVLEARKMRKKLKKKNLTFKTIFSKLKEKHLPIAHYFGTGYGLILQNLDVELVYRVCSHFAIRGIPCLPVHDSFIIENKYEDELREKMHDTYRENFGFECQID